MDHPKCDDLRLCLQTYLDGALSTVGCVEVSALTAMQGGWESDLYAVSAVVGPDAERRRQEWVLRLYHGDGAAQKAEHEFGALRSLHAAGYPVPQVLMLEAGESPLGRPFVIMERILGEPMWALLSRASPAGRAELLALFGQLFARLHRLDWRPFVQDPAPYADRYLLIDSWLGRAHGVLEASAYADLLPVVAWVEERRNRLPCARPAPVHQDLHPGNVLVRADGSAVVIDWTSFEVSDPRFDLAWTLLLVDAYEGPAMYAAVLHEYERWADGPVEELACFEVCACARRLFDIVSSLAEGAERRGMRPEALAGMRRVEPLQRVYATLRERAGLRLARVEELLATLSR